MISRAYLDLGLTVAGGVDVNGWAGFCSDIRGGEGVRTMEDLWLGVVGEIIDATRACLDMPLGEGRGRREIELRFEGVVVVGGTRGIGGVGTGGNVGNREPRI
jgi:hypothetical protein